MSDRRVDVIEREVCFQGHVRLDRVRLRHTRHAGGWSGVITREVMERGHAVALLPYDPEADAVVLIEQFRVGALEDPAGAWTVEAVAGIVEPGEAPEEVARREAREEADCAPEDLIVIADVLVSPGAMTETIRIYCGRVRSGSLGGIHGLDGEGEDIRVLVVPFAEAMGWLASGRIRVSHTVIALQWLALNRLGLRRRWGVEGLSPCA
jgi:ADP-ribose pyrophosphatase